MEDTIARLKEIMNKAVFELPEEITAFDLIAYLDRNGRLCETANAPIQIRFVGYRTPEKIHNIEN